MQEKGLKISDIHIGYETKEGYDGFYDEFIPDDNFVLLLKTKYDFKLNNESKVKVFKNIFSNELVYIKKDNSVFDCYDDESFKNCINHFIDDIITVEDLIKKVKNEERKSSDYRDYIIPICDDLINAIKDKKVINYNELEEQFGNICARYVYSFELITEEDYDELFSKNNIDNYFENCTYFEDNVIDFNNYKAKIRKK